MSPLLHTLELTLATLVIAIPLGTALAWLFVRSDVPLLGVGRLLMGTMLFVPLYLQLGAWQAGFGSEGWHTLLTNRPPMLDGVAAAVWIHSMAALPWVVLIVGIGLRMMEPELEEQAMLDGSPWQVFRHATLPGIWKAIALATLWVTMQTAGEMTVTDFYAVRTVAENAYTEFVAGESPSASLLAMLPTTLLVAAGLTVALRLTAFTPGERPLSVRCNLIFATGPWRWPLAALGAIVLAILVGIPVFSLVCKAGWKVVATDAGRERFWSAAKCLTMVIDSPWQCPRELFWTFVICTLAATTAVVVGGILAWIARQNPMLRWPIAALASLGLAIPGPMLGLCIVYLLNRPGISFLNELNDRSIFAPWLALTLRALPPALILLSHAWATAPKAMLDSAALDGASSIRILVSIVIPPRWPAIAVAWLFAFSVALGDLAASILVVPPGIRTVAIHIFELLHFGVEDQVAGLCLAMLIVFAAVGIAVRWLVVFSSKRA